MIVGLSTRESDLGEFIKKITWLGRPDLYVVLKKVVRLDTLHNRTNIKLRPKFHPMQAGEMVIKPFRHLKKAV